MLFDEPTSTESRDDKKEVLDVMIDFVKECHNDCCNS